MLKINKNHFTLLLFIVIASIPNLLPVIGVNFDVFFYIQKFTINVLFFLILIILSKNLFISILFTSIIILPLEIIYIIKYKTPISFQTISLIYESNFNEAFEYLTGLKYIIIISIINGLIIGFMAQRLKTDCKKPILIKILILFFLIIIINAKKGNDIITDSYPLGYISRINQFLTERDSLENLREIKKDYIFNAKLTSTSLDTVIFIIGETAKKSHWSLFGYNRATTPFLKTQNNIISFSNFISATSLTRTSVPIMLTRKPIAQANSFLFEEKSVISAFNEAGFITYWLSMQIPIGTHDTPITSYANESQYVKFLNSASFEYNTERYDTNILNHLEKTLQDKSRKKFIVIHTLGSHFNYSHRYPKNFDIFKPSLNNVTTPSLYLTKQKKELINSYDNSVIYTDFFIKKVINLLIKENKSSIILYAADHGESIFDGDCDQSGHGLNNKENFEIPAFFWYSSKFLEKNTNIVNYTTSNKDKKLSSANIFYSLLDISNIHYDRKDNTKSFFSKSFVEKDRFINQVNLTNYDKASFSGACKTIEPLK